MGCRRRKTDRDGEGRVAKKFGRGLAERLPLIYVFLSGIGFSIQVKYVERAIDAAGLLSLVVHDLDIHTVYVLVLDHILFHAR